MVQQWLEENAAQTDRTEEEFLQDALDLHVLDRMGKPREIGHIATLLLSEEGDWITGEAINIDGGYSVN
jgi:3-oxoacyl-[acyl-carrier protein] reductase/meso-butanediol dehydrogenase/(S,S)-butanediol dehydrogenase/diacetyl reductase